MQLSEQHFYLNNSSDLSFDKSLAFSHTDYRVGNQPIVQTACIMPFANALYQPVELPSVFTMATHEMAKYLIDDLSAADKSVSIIALTLDDVMDSVSLTEVNDVQCKGLRFSIEIPLDTARADSVWLIGTDQAESFNITVTGMYPVSVSRKLQAVNPVFHCESRERRDHISTGRITCIVNQRFIL